MMKTFSARICLLPQKLGLGGPASFQAGLIKAFRARGIGVTHDPLESSISAILVFGAFREQVILKQAQKKGIRVVQRLNGMNWLQRRKFTGVRHFFKAEYGNYRLRELRRMADRIIYQSQFARSWWEREQGRLEKPQAVIYNGVDLDLFSPYPVARPSDSYRLLMVEAHHGGGYEQGLISAVQLVERLGLLLVKPCELIVVGEVPAELRRQVEKPGLPITWRGVVSHEQIAVIDRTAHLLFSGDLNATCPNAVLEAMACGLPVLAYDTGAMRELVSADAGRIVPYGGDVWKLDKPDAMVLAEGAQEILAKQDELSEGARHQAEANFDIQKIAAQYLEFILGD